MSDLGEMLFLPPLAAALRREAPRARIDNVGVPVQSVSGALEARDVDLAIGILAPTRPGVESETLFHERYVAVTARDWRPAGRVAGSALSARQLAAAPLAVASPTATYHESVQRMLDALGLAERTVVHARHYAALPELVTSTDLLAIVPQMYARAMSTRWPVRTWALPGDAPQYDVRMAWHATATQEASHAWLRALVRRLFARAVTSARPGRQGAATGRIAGTAESEPRSRRGLTLHAARSRAGQDGRPNRHRGCVAVESSAESVRHDGSVPDPPAPRKEHRCASRTKSGWTSRTC